MVIMFILIHGLKALLLKSLKVPLMNRLALICLSVRELLNCKFAKFKFHENLVLYSTSIQGMKRFYVVLISGRCVG